jgi:hypothetical protein
MPPRIGAGPRPAVPLFLLYFMSNIPRNRPLHRERFRKFRARRPAAARVAGIRLKPTQRREDRKIDRLLLPEGAPGLVHDGFE